MGAPLSEDDRRALVDRHLEYVRKLAMEIVRGMPASVNADDLVAYGTEGLIDAAKRFDPSRGASFTTFAYYRIRGAVYDGLRRMGWFGRREGVEVRFAERADALCEGLAAADASERVGSLRERTLEEEVASLDGALADLSVIFVATLESFEGSAHDAEGGGHADDVLERHRLGAALGRLPMRERDVLRMHYVEDVSLGEVGRRMGLSRSWASRLHARAVRLLREEIERAGA